MTPTLTVVLQPGAGVELPVPSLPLVGTTFSMGLIGRMVTSGVNGATDGPPVDGPTLARPYDPYDRNVVDVTAWLTLGTEFVVCGTVEPELAADNSEAVAAVTPAVATLNEL